MESSPREFLEQTLKNLEKAREPVAEELSRIDSEIKKTKASLAPWLTDASGGTTVVPIKTWAAIHELLGTRGQKRHMQKQAIVEKLKPRLSPAQVGQSLAACTQPDASPEVKLTRSGKSDKIAKDEWIGLPEWGPYKSSH